MEDLSGQIIKGYRVNELIGLGGFGGVYRAYQPVIDREVAIKVILPRYANQPQFIRGFEHEAQIIARLEHLHIVPLYDYWRDATGAYIVMRLFKGGSLQDSLTKHGPWPLPDAQRLLRQIASALTTAHQRRVIHQDMKAGNILLDEEKNAYLTDFGIAKDLAQGGDFSIQGDEGDDDQVLHGSPEYMAPEQILRTGSDARSDVYGLGIVMFEVLTGSKPFISSNDEALIKKQLYEPLPRLQSIRADLPETLNLVIQRATDKNPRNRYRSPAEMAVSFDEFVEIAQRSASPTAEPSSSAPSEAPARKRIDLDDPAIQALLVEPRNPYKALRAFEEADAEDFFGRDDEIERLYQRIRAEGDAAANGERFLAVVGASGSGKSSVVKAGLIPKMRAHSPHWFIGTMIPGTDPMESLLGVLLGLAQDAQQPIAETLAAPAGGLNAALPLVFTDAQSELVLFIDQFEELFTLVMSEALRQAFLDLIYKAVMAPDSRVRVILTLRADFYDQPLRYTVFGKLVQARTEFILPMNTEALKAAITEPAARVNLSLEDGLAAEMLADVANQPGSLPLLQFALSELFRKRQGQTMTLAAYREMGGVSGAMTRRADELYLMMSPAYQTVTQQVFLRLVTPGEGTEDTRRRATQAELMALEGDRAVMTHVLDTYGQWRLLSFDQERISRTTTIEIAHEALIREWERLRNWLNASREMLSIQRKLTTATNDWTANNQDPSYLASGARLESFTVLKDSRLIALSEAENQYINASIARRERQNQRRTLLVVASLVTAVVMAVLAAFALNQQQQALMALSESRSRSAANSALLNLAQIDTAALLAVEALEIADTKDAQVSMLTVLRSRVIPSGHLARLMQAGAPGAGRDLALSPSGEQIAAAGADGVVRVWDADGEALFSLVEGHSDAVHAVVYNRSGTRLASAGRDGQIVLWDARTGELLTRLEAHESAVWGLSFDSSDSRLFSAGQDGQVLAWDLRDFSSTPLLTVPGGQFYALAYNPQAERLAVGGSDSLITLLDPVSGEVLGQPLVGHSNWVRSLAFNPAGALLASGSQDGEIRVWAAAAGQQVGEALRLHQSDVRDVHFSADGSRLMTASRDGRVLLLPVGGTGQAEEIISADGTAMLSAVLNADGTRLYAGGESESVMLWDMTSVTRLGDVVDTLSSSNQVLVGALTWDDGQAARLAVAVVPIAEGQDGVQVRVNGEDDALLLETTLDIPRVAALALDAERLLLLLGTDGREVIFFDMINDTLVGEPLATASAVRALSVSADGMRLATGDRDGSIQVWAREDGTTVWQLVQDFPAAHESSVLSLAFSADGGRLASGGRDAQVRLWDLSTGSVADVALSAHDEAVISLRFVPGGARLLSGGRDGQVLLHNLADGSHGAYAEHSGWVTQMVLSPDGESLLTSSTDGTVRLWRLGDSLLEPISGPLVGHAGAVLDAVFNADGSQALSIDETGQMMRWEMSTSAWQQIACHLVDRSLSTIEWEQYLPDMTPRDSCAALRESPAG